MFSNVNIVCKFQILEEFTTAYRELANVASKHDLLDVDPALKEYSVMHKHFMDTADELERKLATQFDLALDQCFTTTQTSTLIQMLGTIMHLPRIMEALEPRYINVVHAFLAEMALIKRTFDAGVANVNAAGFLALPVDPGLPPTAGTLKWIGNLRNRMELPAAMFPYLDYP